MSIYRLDRFYLAVESQVLLIYALIDILKPILAQNVFISLEKVLRLSHSSPSHLFNLLLILWPGFHLGVNFFYWQS